MLVDDKKKKKYNNVGDISNHTTYNQMTMF